MVLACLVLAPLVACQASVEQAPACVRYTACIRALDELAEGPQPRETNLDRFDPGGACWGSETGALLCERACARGLRWETRRNPTPPPECQP